MNEMGPDTTTNVKTIRSLILAGGWRTWASRVALIVLPVVLALVGYYRPQLAGSPLPRPQGDTAFYAYQLQRAAECHGQWWRIAADSRLGNPYPSEFAKHPGLFEGVDLMLLASLFAGAVSAAWAYHSAALAALTVNGWIAAWIVKKITRSTLWALVAVTLITLNESVADRVLAHLHLFKFGWAILAVWAFAQFLKQPAWWRGLLLGLAVALLLQASFYLGFLSGLGLGTWFVVELIAGRVGRNALAGTIVAALAFFVSASLLCFPVLTNYSPVVGSDQYFHRYWAETWIYGSELWKYFVPRNSWLAANYFRDLRHKVPAPIMDEGWNFPGYTVLFAVVIAGAARLRGSELSKKLHAFVWVSLGLMAFWTILSLAGGPSALIFHIVPSFRCYGRAGLLVVALGSVVAPIVLSELVRGCRRRLVRSTADPGLARARGERCLPGRSNFQGLAGRIGKAGVGRLAEPAACRSSAGHLHATSAPALDAQGNNLRQRTVLLVGSLEPRMARPAPARDAEWCYFQPDRRRLAATGRLIRPNQPGGASIRGLLGLPGICVPPRLPGGQLLDRPGSLARPDRPAR